MVWLLAAGAVAAEPSITIEASVTLDGRIVGTLHATGLGDAQWMDPLVTLPSPTDELEQARSFPGKPNVGEVLFTPTAEGFSFTTQLPSRWEDVGVSPHGVFANGAWYPQPLLPQLPEVHWTVHLTGPEGAVLVVGDAVGRGEVHWSGRADRASLAVLPSGRVTGITADGVDAQLVTRGPPRGQLVRRLRDQLSLAVVEGAPLVGVVVEAPLRRRLARSGAGVAYVSDRAWRVFPGFYRLHHRGAVRAVAAAFSGRSSAWERELVGASLARLHDDRLVRRAKVDLLGLTRWIPLVDAAIYTREMPYQAELFKRVVPSDPAGDDLAERFAPTAPAPLVIAQLADREGAEAADQFATAMVLGSSVEAALARAGVPTDAFDALRVPYPAQDLRLTLDDTTATVTRDAPADAPPETVVLDADGTRVAIDLPRGASVTTIELPSAPHRVLLDPDRHVGQTSRLGDLRPAPVRWTLWGQLSSVNLGDAFVNAYITVGVRRADDDRNAFRLTLLTNQRAWLTGRFAWTRYAGRLVQPTTREHAFTVGVDVGWLNPNFGAADGTASLGGTAAWAWDNRESILFPRRGARVSWAVSAGGLPGTDQAFFRSVGSLAGQASPHPRHVFAGRATVGYATTTIPQERLSFGGGLGVRGLPDDLIQTEGQITASAEYRGVPLHQGSLPLGLWWLRDLYLVGGFDAGVGVREGETVAAVGAALGGGVIVDTFGLSPGAASLTFAWPLWTTGVPEADRAFELYLTWGVTF